MALGSNTSERLIFNNLNENGFGFSSVSSMFFTKITTDNRAKAHETTNMVLIPNPSVMALPISGEMLMPTLLLMPKTLIASPRRCKGTTSAT